MRPGIPADLSAHALVVGGQSVEQHADRVIRGRGRGGEEAGADGGKASHRVGGILWGLLGGGVWGPIGGRKGRLAVGASALVIGNDNTSKR